MRSVLRALSAASVALAIALSAPAHVTADAPSARPAAVNPQDALLRPASASELPACTERDTPEPDSPHWWRWQAYHHLDCAMALIDEHIGKTGAIAPLTEDDTVTVPRADLERVRTLALWARDAAARIAR